MGVQDAEKAAAEAAKNANVPAIPPAAQDDVIEMTEDGSFDVSRPGPGAGAKANISAATADEILPATEHEKQELNDMAAKEEEEDKTPPRKIIFDVSTQCVLLGHFLLIFWDIRLDCDYEI